MSIVAEHYQFVIGVDTHAASHAFAIIDAVHAGVLTQAEFPATGSGLGRAVAWAARGTDGHGEVLAVVEGIGSYGARVARTVTRAGYRVVEAQPQPAATRRGKGKSDPLDAVRIARSVLGTEVSELRIPRADGARNALRIMVTARELITRERTATVNALTSLVRTEDLGIDARRSLTMAQLRQIAAWRARANEPIDVAVARLAATRLARHALDLGEQATANARNIHQLVAQVAPELLALPGVGPVTAAVVIVAWSHHGRIRSESAPKPRSPPWLGRARSQPRRATPTGTGSTAAATVV